MGWLARPMIRRLVLGSVVMVSMPLMVMTLTMMALLPRVKMGFCKMSLLLGRRHSLVRMRNRGQLTGEQSDNCQESVTTLQHSYLVYLAGRTLTRKSPTAWTVTGYSDYASIFLIKFPCTSVRRNCRPWKGNVSAV